MLRGCLQVHVIDSHSGSSHHLEPSIGGLEHISGDFRPASDNQSVTERDLGTQFFGRQIIGAINICDFLKEGKASVTELFGDEDGGFSEDFGGGMGDGRGEGVGSRSGVSRGKVKGEGTQGSKARSERQGREEGAMVKSRKRGRKKGGGGMVTSRCRRQGR